MPLCRVAQFAGLKAPVARRQIQTRATPLEVDHLGSGYVDDAPPRGAESSAPVQLLAVHEEAFVEQSDLLPSRGSHTQARADEPIDVLRLVIRAVSNVVAPQHGVARREALQLRALEKQRSQGREAAARRLDRAVGIAQPWTRDGHARVHVQKIHERS